MRRTLFAAVALCVSAGAQAQVTLHGAVQFPDEHVFTDRKSVV